MDKFLNLSTEKQNTIINAALTTFGRNGYKKASISDIAVAAGISKAMVFYYFGSKKVLYLYLIEICGTIMVDELERSFDENVREFFDRIKMMVEIKLDVIRKHPAILSFLQSAYHENDMEVKGGIKKFLTGGESIRNRWAIDEADVTNFKEDVDPKLLLNFLIWASEGYATTVPDNTTIKDYDEFLTDFYKCLDIMKKYFYKSK